MSRPVDQWFEQLKGRPIPALDPVVNRIRDLLKQPYVSNADFGRLLYFAPGLSIEVFRSILRLPEQPKVPIQGISHAVGMLGHNPLFQAIQRTPSINRLPKVAQTGLKLCYSRAIHASHYAEYWAERMKLPHIEEITLAALMDECGEMALWANSPKHMLAINQLRDKGATTDDAALQVLGTSIREISRRLAEYWRLPPLVADALNNDIYAPRPLCVTLATTFARTVDVSWVNPKSELVLELVREYLDLTPDQMLALAHEEAAQIGRAMHFTGLPLSILNLPMMPPPPKVDEKAPKRQAVPKGDISVDAPQATASDVGRHQGVKASITLQLERNIQQLLEYLHRKVGLARCQFIQIDDSNQALQSVKVIGLNTGALSDFQVGLGKNLPSVLIKKPSSLWVQAENLAKVRPLITEELLNYWLAQDFIITTLAPANQPIGLIYADNNRKPLAQKQVQALRRAVTQVSQSLIKQPNPKETQNA
jgi:hypothetical protein